MEKKKRVVRIVTATQAKNRFGEVIKGAYLDDEHLIIERAGIPVAAIVPMADYERLVSADELSEEVAQAVTTSAKEELARQRLSDFLQAPGDRLIAPQQRKQPCHLRQHKEMKMTLARP